MEFRAFLRTASFDFSIENGIAVKNRSFWESSFSNYCFGFDFLKTTQQAKRCSEQFFQACFY
jgi:hypothetical protein